MSLLLGYWKIRGLAEPIRTLLHYLKVEYKDVFYENGPAPDFNGDSWFSVKYSLDLDYPNIPYLFDGDFKMTESQAIMRYICSKYNPALLGETIKDKAMVDMAVGVLYDVITAKSRLMYGGKDCDGHEGFEKKIKEKLDNIEKVLGKYKYIAGDKITFADFLCVEVIESINVLLQPILDKYPNIKRHFELICDEPEIKKYRTSDSYVNDPLPFNGRRAKLGGEPLKK